MKLYGSNMTRSFRCNWAAEEAGLEYEYVKVKFGSSDETGTNSETYLSINSQGKVPTLVDDSVEGEPLVLTESAAIVNYLAAKSGKALRPVASDIVANAKYDELMFFIMADLEQPLWTNGKHRFAIPKAHRVADVLPTTIWEFEKSQKALTNLIGEAPTYALGDSFTMVDIMLAHTLMWGEAFNFKLLPGLKAYKDQMYQREACQRAFTKANAK
jgi:glutathione S-transferase